MNFSARSIFLTDNLMEELKGRGVQWLGFFGFAMIDVERGFHHEARRRIGEASENILFTRL